MENYSLNSLKISLLNLKIGYRKSSGKENVVFGPVNTEISRAEMIGIIGRNGIGKSTLLRTIAGLHAPLRGRILMDGADVGKIPAKQLARRISFVSTEFTGMQQIRVDELIAMGRYPYTGWFGNLTKFDKGLVREAAELTRVTCLMKKTMHELSDGERQKVMIARALAQDTPLIILDEPTAFLDLPSRYDILMILNNLSVLYHKTILFTTHDLNIALDVADKLWLMAEGELYEGAPEDLLINKVFRKLFLNSPVEFDAKTSSFRLRKECNRVVVVQGGKKYRQLTKRTMERIGYHTMDEGTADVRVKIEEGSGNPVWECLHNKSNLKFYSLYDLAGYLKSLH
jgi:iron complex transport system ATP-binding protein